MSHLERVLSQGKTSGRVSPSTRDEDLRLLNEEFENAKAQFYELITAPLKPSYSQFELDSDQVSTANVTPFRSMVRTNDEESQQLDFIHGTVSNLREIGYEINEEINVHSRLLEDIENREDEIFQKAKTNEARLREYIAEKSNSLFCLWSIVLVLFVVFVLVLLH